MNRQQSARAIAAAVADAEKLGWRSERTKNGRIKLTHQNHGTHFVSAGATTTSAHANTMAEIARLMRAKKHNASNQAQKTATITYTTTGATAAVAIRSGMISHRTRYSIRAQGATHELLPSPETGVIPQRNSATGNPRLVFCSNRLGFRPIRFAIRTVQAEQLPDGTIIIHTDLSFARTQEAPPMTEPLSSKLTPDQRLAIRQELDGAFDDKAGCYLAGQSDKAIGARLNVPWAAVKQMRENAYGLIRVDPEIQALREEIDRLSKSAAELSNRLSTVESRFQP